MFLGGREIWPASRFERSATTNNSFLRGRVSPLVIFHARLDGAFIVSSKEGALPPSREMFSRLARCLSRLSTNSSYQSRSWRGVRGIYTGARSDLDNRQRASRPHWIIPDSPPPRHLLKQRGCPPQMSRNCDKEVANHWRNTRALSSSARSSYERLTFDDDFFLSF